MNEQTVYMMLRIVEYAPRILHLIVRFRNSLWTRVRWISSQKC